MLSTYRSEPRLSGDLTLPWRKGNMKGEFLVNVGIHLLVVYKNTDVRGEISIKSCIYDRSDGLHSLKHYKRHNITDEVDDAYPFIMRDLELVFSSEFEEKV